MALIQWDDSFSIGVEKIDAQHKTWISTINDLHDALTEKKSDNLTEKTNNAIDAMWEYTRFHFKTEEAYMKSINYPDLPRHQAIHDKFSLDVLKIHNDVKDGKMVLSTTVMKMLTNWLQEHILKEDKKIKSFLP